MRGFATVSMNEHCPLNTRSSSSSRTVMFAYEQCLLVLGHHPDIWYEAAQYLEQSSKLLAEKGVRDEERQTLGAKHKLLSSCPSVSSPSGIDSLCSTLCRT